MNSGSEEVDDPEVGIRTAAGESENGDNEILTFPGNFLWKVIINIIHIIIANFSFWSFVNIGSTSKKPTLRLWGCTRRGVEISQKKFVFIFSIPEFRSQLFFVFYFVVYFVFCQQHFLKSCRRILCIPKKNSYLYSFTLWISEMNAALYSRKKTASLR